MLLLLPQVSPSLSPPPLGSLIAKEKEMFACCNLKMKSSCTHHHQSTDRWNGALTLTRHRHLNTPLKHAATRLRNTTTFEVHAQKGLYYTLDFLPNHVGDDGDSPESSPTEGDGGACVDRACCIASRSAAQNTVVAPQCTDNPGGRDACAIAPSTHEPHHCTDVHHTHAPLQL